MRKGMELGLNTIVVLIVVMIVLLVVMLYFTGGAKTTFGKMKSFASVATGSSGEISAGIGGIVANCPPEIFTDKDCTSIKGGGTGSCGTDCTCSTQGAYFVCTKAAEQE